MPLYSILCKTCLSRDAVFRKVDERDNLDPCVACGGSVERIIDSPSIQTSFDAYYSPKTGKYIESRNAQREDLKVSGAFLYEKGVEKDVERNRIATRERAFEPIAKAVDSTVRDLVNSGKMES
jgi:putative FmdB family regulatory protein